MGNANKSLALLLVALFLASLVQLPCASVKADSSDDWVMFHHDPSHTGVTTGAGPTKPDELWSYEEGHFLGYYTGVESSCNR